MNVRPVLVIAATVLLAGCDLFDDDDDDPILQPPAPTAEVRVLHASPDAPNVDVLVDDVVVLTDVPFKAASGFLQVEAGDRNIKVNATGTDTTVIDVTPNLPEDEAFTAIAVDNVANIEALLLTDTRVSASATEALVRVVHGAPAAPAVDVYVTGTDDDLMGATAAVAGAAFKDASDFLTLDAGDYRVRVTAAGDDEVLFDSGTVMLEGLDVLTVVAVESSGTSPISLIVLTNDDAEPFVEVVNNQARVRVVHASPDAPNVDVLADDAVVLTDVPFKAASDYLTVTAGERNFKVNATGTSSTVIDVTPDLMRDADYSVLAVNFLSAIEPLLLEDMNESAPEGSAKVRVIHASPDAPNVDVLVDDLVVLTDVPFTGVSDYLEVDAGDRNFKVNATGTTTIVIDVTPGLESGSVYTVIAAGALADIEPLLLLDN